MGEELLFVPLGGSGEIGMNLNLYGYDDSWLMVDCGMMISSVDGEDQIFVPDIEFLRGKRLVGMVLTHAHEDHIGGIVDLWLELRCPLYATPFTAAVIRRKLSESEIRERVPLKIQPAGSRFQVEGFDCEFIPVTHSTVEAQALALRTPAGTVFHTGDWKLDPDPLLGKLSAVKRIKEIGGEGVLAVVGDSTNAQLEGTSGSEAEVLRVLRSLILKERGRVVCASFSSNIARLQTFFQIASETGRNPVIVGRSLKRMIAAAQETGYLSRTLATVPPRDAMFLPPDRIMLICTGSQGEARAALGRIANQSHPDVYLDQGDSVFFSSKVIPGNEEEIARLKQGLKRQGVKVIDEEDALIHVSGHPCVDELKQLYQWLTPNILIPVHGYPPHLEAHAGVGRSLGIPHVIEVRNGDVVSLEEASPHVVDKIYTGRRQRPPEPVWQHRPSGDRAHGRRGYRDDERGSRSHKAGRDAGRGKVKRAAQKGSRAQDLAEQRRQDFLERFASRRRNRDL